MTIALMIVLVIGLVLLDRRLAAVRTQLQRLDALDDVERRLASLAGELDRKELNAQVQSRLTEFTESNRRLSAALTELRRDVDGLRGALAERPAAPGPAAEPDVAAAVRAHLESAGFRGVRVLSDLTELAGRSGKVVFEAHRDGAIHKGHVEVRDGAVVDQNVRAAYSAFP